MYQSWKLQPGRTVTLVEDKDSSCWGLAYEITNDCVEETKKYLDFREKAGYVVCLFF